MLFLRACWVRGAGWRRERGEKDEEVEEEEDKNDWERSR
jgi:hypothetical protein